MKCTDCGADTYELGEEYCLRDDLRRRVGPDALCVGCLEGRLGRRTGKWDYDCGGAWPPSRSKVRPTRRSGRLADRLGLEPLMEGPAWLESMKEEDHD